MTELTDETISSEYCRNDGIIPERIGEYMKGNSALGGGIYGFAFLGALVYYLQHATTFLIGIIGIFKAIFWPAFLMYKVLELLKM